MLDLAVSTECGVGGPSLRPMGLKVSATVLVLYSASSTKNQALNLVPFTFPFEQLATVQIW